MPFVIQGFALSFRSLTDIFFNGACSAMIELTVVMKDSKDLSTLPLFTSRIASQFALTRYFFLLSFLKSIDILHIHGCLYMHPTITFLPEEVFQ